MMGELCGVFTLAQASAAGLSTAEVRRRIRDGRWIRLRHGVYAPRSYVDTVGDGANRQHALDVAALLVTLRFPAVAAAESAARIWGVELLRQGPGVVIVTNEGGVAGVRRNGYVLRTARVPQHHQETRHGVPVTSVARTVFDLSRRLPFIEGVVAADSALRRGLVSRSALEDVLRECWNWPRVARARRVFEFADPDVESALESVSRVALYEQGLPRPRTQVTLFDERGMRYRVDFLWEEARVIGEADGIGKYEPQDGRSTRQIVQAEKRREEWLTDTGYEVVRWGWDEARHNQHRLAHRVRAALARGVERAGGRTAS